VRRGGKQQPPRGGHVCPTTPGRFKVPARPGSQPALDAALRDKPSSAKETTVAEPMYLLNFRRMIVEKIEEPKPPPGYRSAMPPAPEDPRNAGITFAVLGTPVRHGDNDDKA
jgi:hypothetical protein